MRRLIPSQVRREIDRQESGEFYLVFLDLKHSKLAEKIRVVSDPENFILDGNEYIGFEFNINLLTDTEQMPTARLSVQNVDRRIGEAVLNSTDPVRIEIQVIAGSQFDLSVFPRVALDDPVERIYRAKSLYLVDVKGDALSLSGTIKSWDYTQETWPALRATQERFPGLYW